MSPVATLRRAAAHTATESALFARLARGRQMTMEGMLAAIPTREPQKYLYEPLIALLSRMGKGLRSSLCLATCAAFGGDEADAYEAAVALEMLHNAFIIHDDIEDESELRRGKPTLNAEYGVPLALNAGDMLNSLALQVVRRSLPKLGSDVGMQVLDEFAHLTQESLEGQAMELGWIRDNRCDITERDYLRMVLKKTCWYSFIHPCRIGALIATRGRVALDRFNRLGYYLGAAFQIQDDLLNLTGTAERYGKEIGGDLFEGKRTLMLVHASQRLDPAETERLQAFLGRPRAQRSTADVDWLIQTMQTRGSMDYARSAASQLAGAALYEHTRAFGDCPESEHTAFVRELIHYCVQRDS